MKTAVMTDTNSGIMKAEADSMGIFLIPMPVIIDDETHYEGIDLTEDSFYGSLTGRQNVSTSQPSPGDLMDLWDDILEQGYDEIIHIPMSSGLSASCSTAISLSDDYDGKVQVADNHRISVTQRESVMHAKKLAEAGKSAKEIKEVLEAEAYNSSIYIAVDTLEFLKKGGRVTAAGAALGSVLNIKPILTIQGGKLDAFAKTRGMKKCKQKMVEALKNPVQDVNIALVGKYTQLHDAYISVVEALKHGGIAERATVNLKWVDSETLTEENISQVLGDVSGILVPGGFGSRGVEGMILAAKYARENQVPYLGLCLGMQVSIIEYARHVCGLHDAHSIELDPNTTHPVIALMPDQDGVEDIGGTLRLGSYPCVLKKDSKAYTLYGEEIIHERHRHRYEVNNDFRNILTEKGMELSGLSPDGRIVEMVEIPAHPWFVATQAHPEFKSRPNRPHPLFKGFVKAAIDKKNA